MPIPETPDSVQNLDLMKLLEDYAEGRKTWHPDGTPLGSDAKKASRVLHTQVVRIVEQVFAFIMDRATARELDTFTMHDRRHGRKIAHLMWHIISPARRGELTSPEIGMLVVAAHLHDAGMALNRQEREARLAPESDIWARAEANATVKRSLQKLREALQDEKCPQSKRRKIEAELLQAEDALLALDARERHATRERYIELIEMIREYHDTDRTRIPDIEECLSFDGESFKAKLIEICVSHNDDAQVLVEKDREVLQQPRFPKEYPVGLANTDTHLIAAALRLADILDFDRERTPPVLFHYLVPGTLGSRENISALEWGKHMSISNWDIEQDAIVFRGRCKSHVVHHAIVHFCAAIQEEIAATRATFGDGHNGSWPFRLPSSVQAQIIEEGYHYVPYRFELDDGRVYELLMGGAIYENQLMAIRELVQNAVDACRYRDALSRVYEPGLIPDTSNRITVRYEEPTAGRAEPLLRVIDSGTGMDKWAIERWFLKVGRSFYDSSEFNRSRIELRKHNVDFAPVSEFGIGFLSCFLLADQVEVETAMWEPVRGDTRKRHLDIDGPTRLIRIRETGNEGLTRFKGTKVTLHLTHGGRIEAVNVEKVAPEWKDIQSYLRRTCQDLPYRLNFEHVTREGQTNRDFVDRRALTVDVPQAYRDKVLRIPVSSPAFGLEGEIAIIPSIAVRELQQQRFQESPIDVGQQLYRLESVLLRGGFNVGEVPGLPGPGSSDIVGACIRLLWASNENRRYHGTNLARTTAASTLLRKNVIQTWFTYLIENHNLLPDGFMSSLDLAEIYDVQWDAGNGLAALGYDDWLEKYDAFTLYELARNGWHYQLMDRKKGIDRVANWEAGEGSVPLHITDLYGALLEIILPRVAPNRQMGYEGGLHLESPVQEWRDVLRQCRDFLSKPVRWQPFVRYVGKISERLFHSSLLGIALNSRFADRFNGFGDRELARFPRLLADLVYDRDNHRPTSLDSDDVALLERAIDVAGELEISYFSRCWRLDSFRTKLC